MNLNEKLVVAAARVYARTPDHMPALAAAIEHYLTNRTLPDRMRESAKVLAEANERVTGLLVSESVVRQVLNGAANIEAEDRAMSERKTLVDEVACRLYRRLRWSGCGGSDWTVIPEDSPTKAQFRAAAGDLLDHFGLESRGVS